MIYCCKQWVDDQGNDREMIMMEINDERTSLKALVQLFLRLGLTAFGGPAAHIAMLRDEVVDRRKWMDDDQFLDLLGATNLIPGPNSTEMVMHVGYLRRGLAGLVTAGISFILPAMLLVMGFAWAYKEFGTLPQVDSVLYGVKPVIIAVILQALWGLGKKAVKGIETIGVGLAVLILYFLGVNELLLLGGGGLAVMIFKNFRRLTKEDLQKSVIPLIGISLPGIAAAGFNFSRLFFTFLKIGAVLYGSGYVLLAFLRADLVERLGWLTDQQLIDAVAVGQVTPGPVFTTSTFVGYFLGDVPGALVATVGIFLPSFIFVAVSNPVIPRIRESAWASAFLDGVNVAALGLMAAVTFQLARAALVDPFAITLGVISVILTFWLRINSAWLVLGGAALGLVSSLW